MEDLLRELVHGSPQPSKPEGAGTGEDPLAQLLQGLMGSQMPQDFAPQAEPEANQGGTDFGSLLQGMLGSSAGEGGQVPQEYGFQPETGPAQGEMDLGGLLGALLGGGGGLAGGAGQVPQDYGFQPETGPAQGGLDLGGLLGAILGGGGGQVPQGYGLQPEPAPAQGELDLGGLLGGMLGAMLGQPAGTTQAPAGSAGGFGGLLGAIMGGGSPTMESDAFLAPIVSSLAEKLNLPPQIVQAVVAFVLGKLMGRRLQPGIDAMAAPTRSQAVQPADTHLDDMVQRMQSGKRVTKTQIRSSGLAKELSAETGLDRATAETALQEVLNALGGELGAAK